MFDILSKLFNAVHYFSGKTIYKYTEYDSQLIKWFFQIAFKNKIIYENKTIPKSDGIIHDSEDVTKHRGYVYWIDFGINIGSEFNSPHFGVVIKSFKFTSLVIPLSTIKETKSNWKNRENLIIPIGKIEGLKGEKLDCFAMVNQIKSMSNQRLSEFYDKTLNVKYDKLKLSNYQMDLIDNAIMDLIHNKTYIEKSFENDYY